MNKLKSFLPFLFFFIFPASAYCQNVKLKISPLSGTWVESERRSDTIVFLSEYDGQNPVFTLKRGFRRADGYKLPDFYSGPYNFKLGQNNISVFWFLSSGSFQTYYFKLIPEENKFKIGNFFKDPEKKKTEPDTLIFIRIK